MDKEIRMNLPVISLPRRVSATTALQALIAAASITISTGTSAVAQTGYPPLFETPYIPTPQRIVDKMLALAKVRSSDVVYDLGCGDGRIVITAAKKRGARGVGIDNNPQRIAEANANAQRAGVTDKVRFIVGDLYKTDFSEATVVTLYLLPEVNRTLRPQLWKQLKVGTRVVSHAFDMGNAWLPEREITVNGEKIYLWTITKENKREAERQ
jgi:SAM-dependent methyltransferase